MTAPVVIHGADHVVVSERVTEFVQDHVGEHVAGELCAAAALLELLQRPRRADEPHALAAATPADGLEVDAALGDDVLLEVLLAPLAIVRLIGV